MKVALIFGASRGIGANIALTLSKSHHVVIMAKTQESKTLPGTIHSVLKEVESNGGSGTAIKVDVTDVESIKTSISLVLDTLGRIDVIIYNAGAILWKSVAQTTLKQYDLMHKVNTRGFLQVILSCYPELVKRDIKIIAVAPPIYSRFFKGKTPYAMTKVATSVLAMGLANEVPENVGVCCLWPATAISSFVTDKLKIEAKNLRKPQIFSDCIVEIINSEANLVNGRCLIDEDYLRERGINDFSKYRCDPNNEPPRMMPLQFPNLKVKEENAKL